MKLLQVLVRLDYDNWENDSGSEHDSDSDDDDDDYYSSGKSIHSSENDDEYFCDII